MFLLSSPANILRKRWKAIVFSAGLVAVLAAGVSLLMPLEYRADAEVLIISKSRYGVDPYTTVKSAERIGENLIQVMLTDDFYQKVKENNPSLDWTQFEGGKISERAKRKRWQKALETSVVYGTGVMHVSVYGRASASAKALAGATVDTLSARGWEYVGGDVIIKVVNRPIVTRWPARPNLLLNSFLGFLFGAIMIITLIVRERHL